MYIESYVVIVMESNSHSSRPRMIQGIVQISSTCIVAVEWKGMQMQSIKTS